jgi:signal transduction histidine kinase
MGGDGTSHAGQVGDEECGPVPGDWSGRRPLVITTVTMFAAQAGLLLAELSGRPRPATVLVGLDVLAGLAGCALVWLLPRRPVVAAVLAGVLVAVSPVTAPVAGTATLWTAARHRLGLAAVVAVPVVAGQLLRAVWRPVGGLSLGWWAVLLVAVYAALIGWGAQVRARRELVGSLRERARRAEADRDGQVARARAAERTRIAREMHDVLGHRLSLLAAYAGALEFRPDAPAGEQARAVGVLRAAAHQAMAELREVIGVLRDPEPDAAGASTAGPGGTGAGGSDVDCNGADGIGADGDSARRPQPTLADIPRLVGESRAAGLDVRLDDRVAGAGAAVPATQARHAYRIVQEGLTNVRKHAPGGPVSVRLAGGPGERLTVEISNDLPVAAGVGARTTGADRAVVDRAVVDGAGRGTGLIGLDERVRLVGGSLEHGAAGGRFRLVARLPWPR